jgi:thiol-disulfide isomerase/thioredoxin
MNVVFLLCGLGSVAQGSVQEIPKAELPSAAACVVCEAKGVGHEAEKPVAGLLYKGKPYYFCNKSEPKEFKRDPELYVPLALPMVLPAINLTDQSGKVWGAEAFTGKLVLLDYWATWCQPCHALKPKLDKLRETYGSRGFELLSISIDEKRRTLENFLKKSPFANPVAFDDKQTWSGFKVIAIPAVVLVNDGTVVGIFRGNFELKTLETAIRANLR